MSSTAFTVIIPVYNKRPHIERAVLSVLNQSYTDFELILIDDASTDGSMDAIAHLDDPRIVRARRETPGPGGYAARNLGIRMARYEWMAFLDADDEWKPEMLAEFQALREAFPEEQILCTGFIYMRGKNGIINSFTSHQKDPAPRRVGLREYLRETRKGRCPIHTSCVCIHKDLLNRIGAFPEERCRRGGDRDTWLRAVDASKIAWSPYIGELYHCDSVNMVTKTVPEGEGCSLQTLEQMIAGYSQENGMDTEKQRVVRELKRLKNNLIEIQIKKAAKEGHLSLSKVREYSFSTSPISYGIYSLLAVLPDSMLRVLIKLFFMMKSAV